jgi:hypothetical protein
MTVVLSYRIPSCLVLGYQLSEQNTSSIINVTVTLVVYEYKQECMFLRLITEAARSKAWACGR